VSFDGAFPDGRANENADSRDHGRISHSGLFQSPAAPIEEQQTFCCALAKNP
jgi:hypothetical protein